MNSKKYITPITLLLLIMAFLNSCKKDNVKPAADIFYSVSLDGYTVTFTNQTTGAVSYEWDFGDGQTSTEESPVHTYPGKGKFVPTLYATTADGITTEGSTVINIAKSSGVKLNDNLLSDWDTVTHNVINTTASGGIIQKVKFDYDSENIYFYLEMNSTESNGDIFDFYIDSDNDPGTGLITWLFTGSGNDVLIEGAMLTGWFDLFYHIGEQNSFSFDYQSISEFYEVGTAEQDGPILKFEGKIKRAKIKGLTGKGMKIGITATKNDWSETLGIAPDPATPAFYLDMSE